MAFRILIYLFLSCKSGRSCALKKIACLSITMFLWHVSREPAVKRYELVCCCSCVLYRVILILLGFSFFAVWKGKTGVAQQNNGILVPATRQKHTQSLLSGRNVLTLVVMVSHQFLSNFRFYHCSLSMTVADVKVTFSICPLITST